VRSGDDDKTLASVIVRLEPGGLTGRTDSAGRYQFRDVIPARYTLMAEAKRRHPYHSRAVAVGAKRETEHDFRLGRQQCPDTENLANNPSMEAGGGGGGKPGVALGFEPPNLSAYRGGSAEISDAEAHTGRRSQRLRVRSGDPTQPIIRQITHYGTIEPGKHYVIGIWIKAECSDGRDGASITFDFTDNGGAIVRRVAGAKEVTGQSKAWVYVALDGQAPPGSQRLSLNLHVRGSGGYAYFDDAFIGEAPERR
jgi:hypothetical protein